MKPIIIIATLCLQAWYSYAQLPQTFTVAGPGKQLQVKIWANAQQQWQYAVQYNGGPVLEPSALGLVRQDGDFSKGLTLTDTAAARVTDHYILYTGKRRSCSYTANELTLHLRNAQQQRDGRSMIQYYQDILQDAATHRLMVNFHGATLPRGWQRTYPNLVTAEAVRGFEYITFSQQDADKEPAHCAMLPFTRNAFDPMDFTPVCLYKIPGIQRATRYVVLARRAGQKWYVAGINAGGPRSITLPGLGGKRCTLLGSAKGDAYFTAHQYNGNVPTEIRVGANDGFVAVIEE